MTLLCVWVLGSFVLFQRTFGVVHQLTSSLNVTDRIHACTSELLTLTCNATGRRVEWSISDTSVSLQFENSDNVNTVRPHGTESYISALLLNNQQATSETAQIRNFLTIIFIDVAVAVSQNALPNTIICTAGSLNQPFYGSIAEIPGSPQFVDDITYLGCSYNSLQYKVQWTKPRNIDSFDLDHYELAVGDDVMNVDAKENSLIVSINASVPSIELQLIAVDRCGVNSATQNRTINANPNYCVETKPSASGLPVSARMDCKLSGGATAGIVIACITFVILLLWSLISTLIIIINVRKKNKDKKGITDENVASEEGSKYSPLQEPSDDTENQKKSTIKANKGAQDD